LTPPGQLDHAVRDSGSIVRQTRYRPHWGGEKPPGVRARDLKSPGAFPAPDNKNPPYYR